MLGPSGGGFLNLGAPEVLVVGAVAYALIGPKELYKLARQAGEFLGEWQQLGQQAQSTFKDALEQELADDDASAAGSSSIADRLRDEANAFTDTIRDSLDEVRGATTKPSPGDIPETLSAPPPDALEAPDELLQQLRAEMGDPEANRANFAEQISGDRNARVLAEDRLGSAEESLLDTQIAEAENQLAILRTEQEVLAMRRKQELANAERARRALEDEVLAVREAEAAAASEAGEAEAEASS